MTFATRETASISKQRGRWLRCFLGKACIVLALWFVASGVSWARVETTGSLHLWRLHGVFVDSTGKPIANAEVTLAQNGRVVYKTTTDESGRFVFGRAYGRYLLHIDRSKYSQLSREVIVGVDIAIMRRTTLYVIAGPGACTDDCSSVFTSKSEFERTIRRDTGHHN